MRSQPRRAKRNDANQSQIVDALRQCGAVVWVMGDPFDLLVRYRRQFFVLEVKNADGKGRLTDGQQNAIRLLQAIEMTSDAVPVVHDAQEALAAIGAIKGWQIHEAA
jgi:hypothetical protein